MRYTENDLYDGMMIIWAKEGSKYTDSNVYKWDRNGSTVRSNRGRGIACDDYTTEKILSDMNGGHCRPEIPELLIFN